MDSSRAMAATLVGAAVGGIAAYLLFTEHGRRVRRQIEPALDDFAGELTSFHTTIQKATEVASQGWKILTEAIGDTRPALRYRGRQPSTF
jgi:gas vesicle protein